MSEPPVGRPITAGKPFRIAAVAMGLVALLLIGVLVVGLLLPGEWEVERVARVDAGAERVFSFLTTAEGWAAWTPMPDSGVEPLDEDGATGWRWDDPRYGEGAFTIVEADPPRWLRYRVEVEGGALRTEGRLDLEDVQGATRIRWREAGDFGRNPLLGYFASRMAEGQGSQMERSLERLRRIAEDAEGGERRR